MTRVDVWSPTALERRLRREVHGFCFELDSGSAREVIGHMTRAAGEGTAFVIATHDPEVASAADRTFHLRHGSIEAEAKDTRRLSVIDEAGRIQLPADWRRLFPDRRAQIREQPDHLRIEPP